MDLNLVDIGALDVALNLVEGKPPLTRRARSTTREEREELRKQGKCCRCGGDGHWSDKCPLEPFRPASRGSSRGSWKRKPVCSSGSDDENSDGGYSSDNSDFMSRAIVEARARGRRSDV